MGTFGQKLVGGLLVLLLGVGAVVIYKHIPTDTAPVHKAAPATQ